MYNPAEYLFFKLVQKANASEFSPWRLGEFVQEKEFKIQRIGILLQFLGLAERSENGWAANYRLMSIIGEQLARRSRQKGKVKVTDDDRAFLRSLYEFATGVDLDDYDYDDNEEEEEEEERYAANWCWNVLAALGLINKRDGKHWGFKPTPRLKRLFERAPVVNKQIEQIKRLSLRSSNILHLNTTRDPQPDETPLGRSPPPRVASANSIEAAAATPGSSVDTLRARVVGKPVLGVTNPLSRRSTVPVPPFYSKRTGEWPATFRSAAAKQSDEKGVRLQNPVFRGQPAKVLRQPEPTKLSAKLPKLSNRKAQEKKAKRPSGDEPSDW